MLGALPPVAAYPTLPPIARCQCAECRFRREMRLRLLLYVSGRTQVRFAEDVEAAAGVPDPVERAVAVFAAAIRLPLEISHEMGQADATCRKMTRALSMQRSGVEFPGFFDEMLDALSMSTGSAIADVIASMVAAARASSESSTPVRDGETVLAARGRRRFHSGGMARDPTPINVSECGVVDAKGAAELRAMLDEFRADDDRADDGGAA